MTCIPLKKIVVAQFSAALKAYVDCVHVGTWRDNLGANVLNVPALFVGLPSFGLDVSGITRSDVCAYIATDHIPASYVLTFVEHFWYNSGGPNPDNYYTVVAGAPDPTGSFWCLFLRPTVPPK